MTTPRQLTQEGLRLSAGERDGFAGAGPCCGREGKAPIVLVRPCRSRRAGFTLLELMLVLSIAAVVLTMGLPPFVRAMKKEDLRKAVSDLVEGCSHARAQAILTGVPMELVIRAEDGDLAIRPLAGANAADQAAAGAGRAHSEERAARVASHFHGRLPDDVAVKFLHVSFQDMMEFPEASVRFFPNGTSDEFTIILSSASGERKVSLDIITALASVEVIR